MPRVDAASQVIDDNSPDDDVKIPEEDDAIKKKKRTKEKVGFRDRKVSNISKQENMSVEMKLKIG